MALINVTSQTVIYIFMLCCEFEAWLGKFALNAVPKFEHQTPLLKTFFFVLLCVFLYDDILWTDTWLQVHNDAPMFHRLSR